MEIFPDGSQKSWNISVDTPLHNKNDHNNKLPPYLEIYAEEWIHPNKNIPTPYLSETK
jgi:hypothetical protein